MASDAGALAVVGLVYAGALVALFAGLSAPSTLVLMTLGLLAALPEAVPLEYLGHRIFESLRDYAILSVALSLVLARLLLLSGMHVDAATARTLTLSYAVSGSAGALARDDASEIATDADGFRLDLLAGLSMLAPLGAPLLLLGIVLEVSMVAMIAASLLVFAGLAAVVAAVMPLSAVASYEAATGASFLWKQRVGLLVVPVAVWTLLAGIATPTEAAAVAVAAVATWVGTREGWRRALTGLARGAVDVGRMALLILFGTAVWMLLGLAGPVPAGVAELAYSSGRGWGTAGVLALGALYGAAGGAVTAIVVLAPLLGALAYELGPDPIPFGIGVLLAAEAGRFWRSRVVAGAGTLPSVVLDPPAVVWLVTLLAAAFLTVLVDLPRLDRMLFGF